MTNLLPMFVLQHTLIKSTCVSLADFRGAKQSKAPRNIKAAAGRGSTLDSERNAHAAADAKRGKALFRAAALHFVQKRDKDAGARRADRMADRDRAAIDIHDRRIPTHVLVYGQGLCREGFVRLDEIEILDLPVRLFQHLAR